jgi:3-oxoacyl-[acyl-carrier-protein] synthase III
MFSVGIRSLAVNFPNTILTNDYYRESYPELIAQVEQKNLSKVFSLADKAPRNEYDQEMMPYLEDPFRGCIERRVLGPGETTLTLSYQAATQALEAAKLGVEDIDLMLVATTFPEQVVPGNAAFLASQLGLRGAAWNIDSTCTSGIVALQTACALVQTGQYRNVLVVLCTAYSRFTDRNDTLSFLSGDGAAAYVVSSLKSNQGVLGLKILNTAQTCGIFSMEMTTDAQNNPRMFIRPGKGAAKIASNTAIKFVRECCEGALAAAGVTKEQIDFFAFYTPTAWYRNACVRALGIDLERTLNFHDRYGNAGLMLPFAYLYHGTEMGKIRENDLVLVYALGTVSNAGAAVMRWGDVALGPAPAPPISHQQKEKILSLR